MQLDVQCAQTIPASWRDIPGAFVDSISVHEARSEVIKHHRSWSELIEDLGWKPNYPGAQILGWLGYQ